MNVCLRRNKKNSIMSPLREPRTSVILIKYNFFSNILDERIRGILAAGTAGLFRSEPGLLEVNLGCSLSQATFDFSKVSLSARTGCRHCLSPPPTGVE